MLPEDQADTVRLWAENTAHGVREFAGGGVDTTERQTFVDQTKDAIHTLASGVQQSDRGAGLAPMLHIESDDGVEIHSIDPRFFIRPTRAWGSSTGSLSR